jgi:hypothetical protein
MNRMMMAKALRGGGFGGGQMPGAGTSSPFGDSSFFGGMRNHILGMYQQHGGQQGNGRASFFGRMGQSMGAPTGGPLGAATPGTVPGSVQMAANYDGGQPGSQLSGIRPGGGMMPTQMQPMTPMGGQPAPALGGVRQGFTPQPWVQQAMANGGAGPLSSVNSTSQQNMTGAPSGPAMRPSAALGAFGRR